MSGRRGPRSCRRSPRSRWSGCSSATSPTWSTTASPPRWRTTSTRSRRATRRCCPGSPASTSGSEGDDDGDGAVGAPGARTVTATGSGHEPAPGGEMGLKREVSTYLGEINAREINSIPIGTDSDGTAIVARVGKYGPYLQRGEDSVSIPDGLAPGRADRRARRGAPRRALLRPCPRDRSRDGPSGPAEGRPLRPLRATRRAGRRRAQAAYLLALLVDGTRDDHPRAGTRSCSPSPGWSGTDPEQRRGDRRPQRPVRPVPQAGD